MRARPRGGRERSIVVAENEPQDVEARAAARARRLGLDALWNDDFHHSADVALTGHNEAYYTDYLGTPQEFISAAKWGYLYQGQRTPGRRSGAARRRSLAADGFVNFLENHDQVANSAAACAVHHSPAPAGSAR